MIASAILAVGVLIAGLVWRWHTRHAPSFTTISYGLRTGDGPLRVSNSGGALPTGLRADADHWVKGTSDSFRLVRSPLRRVARALRTLVGKEAQ